MNPSQIQNDIQWVLNSPNLLTSDIARLEFGPTNLTEATRFLKDHSNSMQVGRYFEQLVRAILEAGTFYDVIEQGLQIHADGRTIGELDFIVRDHDGVLTHCETAIKYYLYYPHTNETGSHFIGPNPTDTFESKTNHLLAHQLPLSERYYPTAERRKTFVNGMIFYPSHSNLAHPTPDHLAQDHIRGGWFHARNASELLNFKQDYFCYCQKPHWLAPPSDAAMYMDPVTFVDSLMTHFQIHNHPLMMSRLRYSKGLWKEQERLFIVQDHWPNLIAP